MNRDINFSNCISCGQCVLVCPTAALHEKSNLDEIQNALSNSSLKVAIQFGPSLSVSLAEEFGIKPGKDIYGILVAALRKIGFEYVFDSSFGADLNVIETVAELKERIEQKENLPLITSSCPAWVKYIEQFYPNLLPLLSTCKSPQQMMGGLIKSYFAKIKGVNPSEIFSVAAMPCLAKKSEAHRQEMTYKGLSDVDLVLTTRELARLIKLYGIDINNIDPQQADTPFDLRSSAGKLFATSGGTAEAVFRTLYFDKTGKDMPSPKITDMRMVAGIKHFELKAGKEKFKFVVSNGLTHINELLLSIQKGENVGHFIEVMACPGGCINGGGQPFGAKDKDIKARAKSIYDIDDNETIKCAHKNPMIIDLYEKFLLNAGNEKAKRILYVNYSKK
jgi:NADH-quinone oxidoreductase subunit G/NADP-reducing hydrogenase subunit HndD